MIAKYALPAALIGGLAVGWTAHSWYADSVTLAAQNAADAVAQAAEKRESKIAKSVEDKLAALRANERTRVVEVPEIIKQPELVRVCLSEDAVNSINAAVRGLHDSRDDAAE